MIPGVMVEFLDRASVGVASTRSRDLIPRIHILSGWRVLEDRVTVECGVPAAFCEGLLEALADNGRFAMTAEVIGPHDTYQFKGASDGTRPAHDADVAIHEACRKRFYDAITRCYPNQFSDPAILARIALPATIVRLRVEEIYVQTPGPAAGRRLFPRGRK